MSAPGEPDPARAWTLVHGLLAEEELERLDRLGNSELDPDARGRDKPPQW